ncbi:MAG: YifB family Mg chelatase-like AAA ATPase [Candidatus Omnitrophota bacterium]|nr:MAG: YifB family Mg chelatase-like AAA ATPase [Candidatus Omnitrophota bacterium]
MIAKSLSCTVIGIDAYKVDVESDIAQGLPAFNIIGLPDTAIRESRDRIKFAIKNSGYRFPDGKITVNLAPANIRKEGSGFDLPIALSLLCAVGIINQNRLLEFAICGELSLDGRLKEIKGALPISIGLKEKGIQNLILPKKNLIEVSNVNGIKIYTIESLNEGVNFLNNRSDMKPQNRNTRLKIKYKSKYRRDFTDVKGQEHVKRGLEVASSGGHNALLIGPPGSGKSMLAKRVPTILSEMTVEEILETSKIHSVAGLLSPNKGLILNRPFRNPHHTISDAALAGGGTNPMPGEISLAHNGVLFLDELPEFKRNVLELLRQPIEDGKIRISRVKGSNIYPCRFMLIAALNPCPCGYFTDPKKECHCTPYQIQRYLSKISGPLLDRIDIHLNVPRLNYDQLSEKSRKGETSEVIRKRVNKARKIQEKRYKSDSIVFNARLESKELEKYCILDKEGEELLKMAILELGISARAYDKILKVARTIADLEEKETIEASHISEAISYRSLDRDFWMM